MWDALSHAKSYVVVFLHARVKFSFHCWKIHFLCAVVGHHVLSVFFFAHEIALMGFSDETREDHS